MSHHDLSRLAQGFVSAIFEDAEDAEVAYKAARDMGYEEREITVMLSEQAREGFFPQERIEVEESSKALEGTGVGSAVGLAVGALAGAIAAIGTTLVLPGLGLVVAGPLAAAIAGAGAGGVAGGLLGALVGAGMTEERAKLYHAAIEDGGVIVAVESRTPDDAVRLAKAFEEAGGSEVHRSA